MTEFMNWSSSSLKNYAHQQTNDRFEDIKNDHPIYKHSTWPSYSQIGKVEKLWDEIFAYVFMDSEIPRNLLIDLENHSQNSLTECVQREEISQYDLSHRSFAAHLKIQNCFVQNEKIKNFFASVNFRQHIGIWGRTNGFGLDHQIKSIISANYCDSGFVEDHNDICNKLQVLHDELMELVYNEFVIWALET